MTDVQRIAAFSQNYAGGNPAGVIICTEFPPSQQMMQIAHDVGYSETAFLLPQNDGWRIRYFAPEIEIPFCGHATIAAGLALGERGGPGRYKLFLNEGEISINVTQNDQGYYTVALLSPDTKSEGISDEIIENILAHFNFNSDALHPDFPVKVSSAGARHLILMVKDRQTLQKMDYHFERVKSLMLDNSLTTISVLWRENDCLFHSRNAFATGGVFEDPATGAAAAAFAGYLRDIKWPVAASGKTTFNIVQGEEMGSPSLIKVSFTAKIGSPVTIRGEARHID